MNKRPSIKLNKHSKISFKRKIRIWRDRTLLLSKILIVIMLYIFFFTSHMKGAKEFLWEHFYEISSDLGFRLEGAIIKGNKHLETNKIIETLDADVGTPIFALDLRKIYNKLEDLSWVESVSIRRKLPKEIEINIIEKKPIAIWQHQQKLYLIDEEGNVIISTKNPDKFPNMLHVVGIGANIYAYNLKEDLQKSPDIAENIIAAVRFGERRWNLILKQDITVKMPEQGFDLALDYISKMHKKKKLFHQNYKILDLRNPEKYYIEKHRKN